MGVLYDNHGRPMNYLRLAVTDRCNLRCFYCMPAQGIRYLPKKELLSFEEIERLVSLMTTMGVTKVRLTGGEPFLRNDLMKLIARLTELSPAPDLHITTNGVLTARHVPELRRLNIASINLSLDTLDSARFRNITHRDEFESAWRSLGLILEHGIPLKINAVVMEGKNIQDIIPLTELTRNNPVTVRFIEEMPFNGEGSHYASLAWTHRRIFEYLRARYPGIEKAADPDHSTAAHYVIPGFKGKIGIVAAFSRTFCGTCNRIRVTAQGVLKTCLYDDGVLDVRSLLRSGATDDEVRARLAGALSNRAADGFEAEKNRKAQQPATESMSTIGG